MIGALVLLAAVAFTLGVCTAVLLLRWAAQVPPEPGTLDEHWWGTE